MAGQGKDDKPHNVAEKVASKTQDVADKVATRTHNMAGQVASKVHRFFQYVTQHNQAAAQQAAAAAHSPGHHEGLAASSLPLGRSSIHAPAGAGLGLPAADMPRIKIGVCARDKKAQSKPMKEIISRLVAAGEFEVVVFGDEVILNSPIEEWPECDCLLSWYSDGFPLHKAQAYTDLRKPFLVNDLHMQDVLQDRRQVYRLLVENAIPVPTHIIVDREGLAEGEDPPGFIEEEDYVELNGERIYKPFVEKPASGEDHNIYIYYPHSMGGGVKRLFRKVDDKSSCYDSDHPGTVRRSDSYIYEEFLPTGGTDVKVYTVGPRYAHAEARKSPVVDGKVLRSADGKEMRFPVLLSPQEKEVARMVCLAFGQKVCGFDLLRSEKGKSYVCDVNGWSFVKNSKKYYDDAAGILRSIILSALAPHRLASVPAAAADDGCYPAPDEVESYYTMFDESLLPQVSSLTDLASMAELSGIDAVEARRTDERSKREELRCVLAVIRHGDRTPKQKMKMRVTQPELLTLFEKYKDGKGKQAKLKSPLQLQELLDITRALLKRLEEPTPPDLSDEEREARDEAREKFRIVRTVLEQGGQFSGINRKVQLKPTRWGPPPAAPPTPAVAATESKGGSAGGAGQQQGQHQVARTTSQMSGGTAGSKDMGSSASTGGKDAAKGPVEEAMLILKYGGVLTHAGRQQAWDLGRTFRLVMYPRYGSAGGGLLRLHSTYRHDLKIYSSDEGRVQVSAAAFTKGLLDLEGSSLTPILVSLVQKDASMLDAFGKGASEEIRIAKNALYAQMTYDPATASSAFTPLPGATPTLCSPQMSPKAMSRSSSGAVARDGTAKTATGAAAGAGAAGTGGSAPVLGRNMTNGATAVAAASSALRSLELGGRSGDGDKAGISTGLPKLSIPEVPAMAGPSPANGPLTAGSGAVGSGPVPEEPDCMQQEIPAMPANPLQHLHRLVQLMKVVITQLREMCLRERADAKRSRYSSLSQDPRDWELEEGQPCSGERLLLMFDRWQKLLKSFYNEKKGRFDISKVPDIYDSAKYDVIHNSHLGLACLVELYRESKILADAVIPNEYGIDPEGQLAIGAKICTELLGKLIADLESMREESVATQAQDMASSSDADGTGPFEQVDTLMGRASLQDDAWMAAHHAQQQSQQSQAGGTNGQHQGGEAEAQGGEPEVEGDDYDRTPETIHRLCPTYASDINSPLRHVRTRIYFTSESHMHSLLNVLRFCHLAPHAQQQQQQRQSQSPQPQTAAPQSGSHQPAGAHAPAPEPQASQGQPSLHPFAQQQEGAQLQPLVCEEGADLLRSLRELDYLTHIVFRLYENKSVPPNDPERFRVEILFSPGAAHDPTEVLPLRNGPEHTLPPFPRAQLHNGEGARLDDFERLLMPFASRRFANTSSYALQVGLRPPTQSTGSAGGATRPSPRKAM